MQHNSDDRPSTGGAYESDDSTVDRIVIPADDNDTNYDDINVGDVVDAMDWRDTYSEDNHDPNRN
jgi:hypothetical protein